MTFLQSSSLLATSLLLVECIYAQTLVPNLNWIGRGYDMLKGNPHPTDGQDRGWKAQVVGSAYNTNTTAVALGHTLYDVPEGVEVHSCSQCSLDFQTTDLMSTSDYKSNLRQFIEAEYSGISASFKGSVDFKRVEERASQMQEYVMESSASCSVYCADLQAYTTPTFTENFRNAINSLENNVTQAAEIIDAFGTHYVAGITMGGLFGTRHEMSIDSYQTLVEYGLDVELAASYQGVVASGNVHSLTELQQSDAKTFQSMTSETRTFSVGGQPPADASNLDIEWFAAASEDPYPISFRVERISSLITEENFPNTLSISTKRSYLDLALDEYCSSLQAAGEIQCDDNDTPINVRPDFEYKHKSFGSETGGSFTDEILWDFYNSPVVTGVTIRTTTYDESEHWIASIQLSYSTFDGIEHGNFDGGNDKSTLHPKFELERGDHIVYVFACVKADSFINALQFRTKNGKESPFYGDYRDHCEEYFFTNRLLFIYGRSGDWVDKISFVDYD